MRYCLICLFMFLLIACDEEEKETVASVTPSWSPNYPSVKVGARTMDVLFSTDVASVVYYVIATVPMPYSAAEVKTNAVTPSGAVIAKSGTIMVAAGDKAVVEVKNLFEDNDYYVYAVAESRQGNQLQMMPSISAVTTEVRQDTLSFTSVVEDREVYYLRYRSESIIKNPDEAAPVCFYFGGEGTIGSDEQPINLLTDGSLPEYLQYYGDVPFTVISVQHINKNWSVELIDEAMEHVRTNYAVDESRIYLTGNGYGGTACWDYAISRPETIAAIVPISGSGFLDGACNIKNIDVWAFHNEGDAVIPTKKTKDMVTAIANCGGKTPEGVYFPDTGHNCWRRVYNPEHPDWKTTVVVTPVDIYSWMLSKSRQ
jgi:predicted peptidase